jgi:FtsP/CotA-like multicopper oxidase with cupredoxin domain
MAHSRVLPGRQRDGPLAGRQAAEVNQLLRIHDRIGRGDAVAMHHRHSLEHEDGGMMLNLKVSA